MKQKKERKDREPEVEGMSFPNTKGAMVNEDDEVEVVEDDQDIQVVDMSMEERKQGWKEEPALCGAWSQVSIPYDTCSRVHTGARSK